MRAGSSVIGLVLLVATAGAQPASYSDAREAAVQFERGRTLFRDAKYSEACAAFARSQQLDPQSGTLYNLAGCYVERGLLVSALNAYRDLADHDRNLKRRDDAARRAAALEARLPKLRITAPGRGWIVTMNGVDVTGLLDVERVVDPGVYEIVGTCPGRATFRTTATLADDGKTMLVAIRSQVSELADPFGTRLDLPRPIVTSHPAAPDGEHARLRTYALMTTVGGAALFASGLVFGKLASDTWDEANHVCTGTCTADQVVQANALADRARSRAHAADAFIVVGLAGGGVGAWLFWKTAHEHAIQISPTAGGAPGLTVGGHF